jgi:phage terminase Nu1 subunit (DNA packaging protein)
MPELPRKLPAKGIAILFGVSEQRISQMKRRGQLTPDSSNLYDVQQAMTLRGFQMSEHGVRVIAQEYGNGTGKVAPAKIVPVTTPTEPQLSAEDREALGLDVEISQVAPSPNSQIAAQTRISELREAKLRAELDRAENRLRKERGELVERVQVQRSFVQAGALVANILQNMPAEIAALFPDPEMKAEVRRKVQMRIDQTHHALYSAVKGFGEEDVDGPAV